MVVRQQIKKEVHNDSMMSFEKIRKIRGYQDKIFRSEVETLEDGVGPSEKQGDLRDSRMTPAGCGLDFEGISSPQPPVITARTYRTRNGVVGGQHGRLYRNPHGE